MNYTASYSKMGSSERGFLAAHNSRMQFQYGAEQDDLLPWFIWNKAVMLFWNEVLNLPLDKLFVCDDCGPRPEVLCMDGVSIGIMVDKVQKEGNLFVPISSDEILDAPEYKERMFIKTKKNRKMIIKACEDRKYPNIRSSQFNQDPGLKNVSDMLEGVKLEGYQNMPDAISDLLYEITSVSSSISIFQTMDTDLLNNLKESLQDDKHDFLTDPKYLQLKQNIFLKYPLIFKRLDAIGRMMLSNGKIPKCVKIFTLSLIDFCISYWSSLPVRQSSDYQLMNKGDEVKSECFPLWDIRRKRARYQADQKGSKKDIDAWDELCSKLFPEHSRLTPGLFIVTCCCPKKKVYGFKKMIQGESPRIIFDLIMTRFEDDYNPTIIYDASCRIKEYGLNREPARFSSLRFATDPLHCDNHTSCSQAFQSNIYTDLKAKNKEACEQFNSVLRSVQHSVTYMGFDNYLTALKVFISFHNLQGLEINK